MALATRFRRARRDAPEHEEQGLEDMLVKLYRCATVVKGGRRFSFGALVVVGDRNGKVAYGYGKANEVPPAVEKGIKQAKRRLLDVPLKGTTIPHRVVGHFGASRVVMLPASEGTGVIAGAAPRAVLELAGIKDVLTKVYGSTGAKNLVKATLDGLRQLRTRAQVEQLRGVKLDLPPEPQPAQLGEHLEVYVDDRPDSAADQEKGGATRDEPSGTTPGEPSLTAPEDQANDD